MIPEMKAQIEELMKVFAELETQNRVLRDDLTELRNQLMVPRAPQVFEAVNEVPSNFRGRTT